MIKSSSYRNLPIRIWQNVPFWLRVRHHYVRYYKEIFQDACEFFELNLKEIIMLLCRLILLPVSGILSALIDTGYRSDARLSYYTVYNIHPKLIDHKWYRTEYPREELK